MKLLLDENVPNRIKEGLTVLGFKDIVHINDIAKGIPDNEVFELAKKEERIIITGDDDFKANNFKYSIPIVWITPKARCEKNICNRINLILNDVERRGVKISKAFISIRKDKYLVEYKNKDGVFGKIKKIEISFDSIKTKKEKSKKK